MWTTASRTERTTSRVDADVIVVGAGLAGLVATAEAADAGRRVLLLDQENEHNLGGQAHWSFGGLFLVDSPEQRRMGVHDSLDLAWQDWEGTAGFDREREDRWPRRWARAYVEWAAGEKRSWLHAQGMRWFPVVGWAERGGYDARGSRQLGPPVPRHLGHRPRRRRAVRPPGPRSTSTPAGSRSGTGTRSTRSRPPAARSTASAARCSSRRRWGAGSAARAPR